MATDATLAKYAREAIALYVSLFESKYKRKPEMNRYSARYALSDIIDDIGMAKTKTVIEYYFKTDKPGHPFPWFLGNYEKLNKVYDELQEDARKRAKLREETRKRMAENKAPEEGDIV